MPRLSLYRPERGNNYRYLDLMIAQQFQIGGTDVLVHKYLGASTATSTSSSVTTSTGIFNTDIPELSIEDVVFLENRDRNYDPSIYVVRGIHTMQDVSPVLIQFGYVNTEDTLTIDFHKNSSFDTIGRKFMSGDVLELPHLADEQALNTATFTTKRFYKVDEVIRPAVGYSQTWYPHLYRCKCSLLPASQEFSDIINQTGSNITTMLDTYLQINDAIIGQANQEVPRVGFDNSIFYDLPEYITDALAEGAFDGTRDLDANPDSDDPDPTMVFLSPKFKYYQGYLTGDGLPPNGYPYTYGPVFPTTPALETYFLRTDFFPNRLFRWDGIAWRRQDDDVRTVTQNQAGANAGIRNPNIPQDTTSTNISLIGGFINNDNSTVIGNESYPEKQALSKIDIKHP